MAAYAVCDASNTVVNVIEAGGPGTVQGIIDGHPLRRYDHMHEKPVDGTPIGIGWTHEPGAEVFASHPNQVPGSGQPLYHDHT